MKVKRFALILAIVFIAAGCNRAAIPAETNSVEQPAMQAEETSTVDFSSVNSTYKFSGKIDADWKVEYIPSVESINIYNPAIEGKTSLEQSQIFIRYFRANDFLTLSTVDILSREEANVANHPAVRYEIKKKAGVANFPNQPSWRSGQHKLIDIRLSATNPSLFYVIAYNPDLDSNIFEEFISSLEFEE